MILKCSVDQISNKKVKAIYTELRRNITYSPGLDSVLAVVKIHIFDLLLVGGFSLVSLEDSHSFFNLQETGEDEDLSDNIGSFILPCSSESWSPPACEEAQRCRSQAACR